MKWFALPLVLLATPLAAAELIVRDAWIRSAPPGAVVLAGYATLHNRGTAPIRLVGATSEAFGKVELHEMRMDDGVMRMRPLAELVVPSGSSMALAPGRNHLMLRDPKRHAAAGDRIEIEFIDADGARTPVAFKVR